MDLNYIIVLIVIVIHIDQQKTQAACGGFIPNNNHQYGCSDYDSCYVGSSSWYQSKFWGGFMESARTENSISQCSRYYREHDFLVLLDYVFTGDCGDSTLQFTAKMADENVIEAALVGIGWYSTFQDGRQYMFPSLEYTDTVFAACPDFAFHFLLQVELNGVRVVPEISHTTQLIDSDENTAMRFSPFLQFRCSFENDFAILYKINWYINDTLYTEKGPSNAVEDLVLKGDDINKMELGYTVKCGVIKINTVDTAEYLSLNFFAGWKVSNNGVKLTKGGFVTIDVVLTVPIGCAHLSDVPAHCNEELSITDASYTPATCKGGILAVNANDMSKTYHEVEKLKQNEEWNGSRSYRFNLSTSDVNYDDATEFDLQVRITDKSGDRTRRDMELHSKVIDTLRIYVTETKRHLNKMCYSHVDPHMRTADGRYYEQQREGDYMLLRNTAHQMEIQESARNCFAPRNNARPPPVCACGIVIRFGGDVFMIDRCSGFNFLGFVQCENGGILEVVRVNDYRYRVRTPIGTVIDITLHNNRWKTMNIDVYMSPRDFGNTDGLCGYFDGNAANDFLHRDGQYSNGNTDYRFSNSWRLAHQENLFKNCNRVLETWTNKNGGRACTGRNSITKTKCKPGKRLKCANKRVKRGFERLNLYYPTPLSTRTKRNTQATMTEDEVASLCNASIFESPAVMEMSGKLGNEDLREVVAQCIYDVTEGNDTEWAEAHVQALNNIATTMLELNPVYATNNSELVTTFLSKACLNNCSGNGACSDSGHCSCIELYRGPDCSIDRRVPSIINDIDGGGVCDVAIDNECGCFVIRTDNIFDGFVCSIVTYMVFFNGSRSQVEGITQAGEYEDIFTGVCCTSGGQMMQLDKIIDPFVVMYELSISNDGENYGETIPIYVYDSTCVHQRNNYTVAEIKSGNCFIDNTCFKQGSAKQGDHCSVCDPDREQFRWYKGNCDEDENEFTSATIIGIIVGSIIGIGMITLATILLLWKAKKRNRVVQDSMGAHNKESISNTNIGITGKDDVGLKDPFNHNEAYANDKDRGISTISLTV